MSRPKSINERPAVSRSPTEMVDEGGGSTTRYSRARSTGIAEWSNTAVKTTETQVTAQSFRAPVLYVEADHANTDGVFFGGEGGTRHWLNAGDVWPLFDTSPSDVWVRANSGTQTVHLLATGDPDAPGAVRNDRGPGL